MTSGLTILASDVTFQAYSLLAGTTTLLEWPIDNFPANANVVADLMNITPLGTGCSLQMPSAQNTSLGEKSLIFNSGSNVLTILDNSGNTILTLNAGTAWYLALTNNLTNAGSWLFFQFGTGNSIASASPLAGAGLAANGRFLQQIMQVTDLNSNYTIGPNDRDNLLNWQGGAGTFTLPSASASGNNYYIQVRNSGSGTLTINPVGGDLINGSASISFSINDSAFIVTDGVGWFTIGLGSINTNLFNFQVVSLTGQSGTYVLPSNQQNKVAYRFTGVLAGNTNVQVPNTIQQYWVDNETTGGTLGIGTAAQITGATQLFISTGQRAILYCDGSNVLNADTAGISLPLTISQGGTSATTASAALTNLGGTSVGVAVFTAATVAAAQSALGVVSNSDSMAFAIIF